MGKKGRTKHQKDSRDPVKQIGSCKKFHPDTLTKRLEKKQANQRHKRQNGFEQVSYWIYYYKSCYFEFIKFFL